MADGTVSNASMDGAKFKATMSSLNQGNVMAAAARNLQKELLREHAHERTGGNGQAQVDLADLEQASCPPSCGEASFSDTATCPAAPR